MHILIPSVIDDSRTDLHQPHGNPFDGPARFLTSHIETADQMEQIIGQKPHFQPSLICSEQVAACLVPAQRVLAFLDPVFNITSTVVN